MTHVGKGSVCSPMLLLMILALLLPPLSGATVEEGGQHRLSTIRMVDASTEKHSLTEEEGKSGRLFAFAVSLRNRELGQVIENMERERQSEGRLFRDYATAILHAQATDLKRFQDRYETIASSPLAPSASRSFRTLMTEVLSSFMDDTTELRPVRTEGDFIRFLVAHHTAVMDMAKILLMFEEDPNLRSIVLHMLTQRQIEIKRLRKLQVNG